MKVDHDSRACTRGPAQLRTGAQLAADNSTAVAVNHWIDCCHGDEPSLHKHRGQLHVLVVTSSSSDELNDTSLSSYLLG